MYSARMLVVAFVGGLVISLLVSVPPAAADPPEGEPAEGAAAREAVDPPNVASEEGTPPPDAADGAAPEDDDDEPLRIECEYALVDVPFNAGGWGAGSLEWPSMGQAQSLSKCVYQLGHLGIQEGIGLLADPPIWGQLGVVVFDLLMPGRPFGIGWNHEEWHRAVMTVRGIDSYNEVWDFEGFGGILKVSHVTDADLAALKRDHNPDLVRLAAAGIESHYELNTALERDAFFRGTNVFNTFLLWLDAVEGSAYMFSSLGSTPDDFEQESYETELTEEDKDFVGHDVTSWAYDLFRSDQAYEDRGTHPGGAGVDRSISRDDLTDAQRRYVTLQAGLSLLNFVDPFLLGVTDFTTPIAGEDVRWNATLRHHLTSFGNAVDVNLFLSSGVLGNVFFVLHTYYNYERPYVGLEAQVLDRPLTDWLHLSSRLMLWEQPDDQAFRTTGGSFGGLAGARLAWRLAPWFRPNLEVEAKTTGWVAGNPYLDEVFSARLGFESTL